MANTPGAVVWAQYCERVGLDAQNIPEGTLFPVHTVQGQGKDQEIKAIDDDQAGTMRFIEPHPYACTPAELAIVHQGPRILARATVLDVTGRQWETHVIRNFAGDHRAANAAHVQADKADRDVRLDASRDFSYLEIVNMRRLCLAWNNPAINEHLAKRDAGPWEPNWIP